jgi:hypothetical protein
MLSSFHENPDFMGRFDQVSGERIFIHFDEGKSAGLKYSEVF